MWIWSAQEGAEELAHAVSMVEREKDVAAAAAADASMFAAKTEEILSEMLGSFTTEMANARCKSVQLQVPSQGRTHKTEFVFRTVKFQ
jgi:hypothetical protein